jgi:aldehyde dehydrogenase (NAD+)
MERFQLTELTSQQQMPPTLFGNLPDDSPLFSADLFAPVSALRIVRRGESIPQLVNDCPYGLAASVFGATAAARSVAVELDVGTVVVNDLIAPTADPRLPFGGRRASGFGVTRGAEGLIAMTVPRVIAVRHGGPTPHLDPPHPANREILAGALAVQHQSGPKSRLAGLRRLLRGVRLNRSESVIQGDETR